MPDDNPLSKLELARNEIDRVYGRGYARDHPDVVNTLILSASLDYLGLTVAQSLRDIAVALLEDAPIPMDGRFRPPTILR